MNHTPGPWTVAVDDKGDVAVRAPEYGAICYPLDDNYQANARLIAAAPMLLDAAYLALSTLRTLSDEAGDVEMFNEGGDGYEAVKALKDAIATAEGRTD